MAYAKPGLRAQASIEFLSTYSIALTILVVVVAAVAYLAYFYNGSTQTEASCTISAQIYCVQASITNNGKSTPSANVLFTNGLGIPMEFQQNSILFFPNSSGSGYWGTCVPANALPGNSVLCSAEITGYVPSVGTETESRFVIRYNMCPKNSECLEFNTTGTGTLYVSP